MHRLHERAPALRGAGVPAPWSTDRLVRSRWSRLTDAELVGDADGLLVISRRSDGAAVAGYGPAAGWLVERLLSDGRLDAPVRALDLPRGAGLSCATAAHLALRPRPGWDWLATDRRPSASGAGVVRLDHLSDGEEITACLVEANPGTSAVPGGCDDVGWWGVRGRDGLDGVIGAARRDGAGPSSWSWHLHGLGVRPSARGRGLGSALTAGATRAGLAAGVDWVSLGVWAHNAAAIRIYHRLGFVTEHERFSYDPLVEDPAAPRACG